MRRILTFCLVSTISALLSGQTALDSELMIVEHRFELYEQARDVNYVDVLGQFMPYFPYEQKIGKRQTDWLALRQKMTYLYIKWFDFMLKSGFDISFDRNDPDNQAFIWSVGISGSEESETVKAFEKLRLKNEELFKKQSLSISYERGMENFKCYYKQAYKTQSTCFRVFKRQLKNYDRQNNAKDAKLMLQQFKKASKECKCWWDGIWDTPAEKNK